MQLWWHAARKNRRAEALKLLVRMGASVDTQACNLVLQQMVAADDYRGANALWCAMHDDCDGALSYDSP